MIKLQKVKRPILIGLTGGPGVGKSEIAKALASHGAKVIYADIIGHSILENNKAVIRQLFMMLGPEAFLPNRLPDRKRIGKLVFSKPDKLAAYNSIIHPVLLKILKQEMNHQAKKRGVKMVVVDAALIYEWGIADWFDILVVVDSTRQTRLSRLAKSGLSQNQLSQRIRSQMPQKDKIALADFVIKNNGRLSELRSKAVLLIKALGDVLPAAKKQAIRPIKRN